MAEQNKVRANSRLEQKLEELYCLMEAARPTTFSKSKVVVEREVVYEILEDMRKELPEELVKYHEMTNRYGNIIGEAHDRASTIEKEARDKQAKLINEQEIVKEAYEKANHIISDARREADDTLMAANQEADIIREGAFEYTQNMMLKLQQLLSESYRLMDGTYRPFMEGIDRELREVNLAIHGLEEPLEEEYGSEPDREEMEEEAEDEYEDGYDDTYDSREDEYET